MSYRATYTSKRTKKNKVRKFDVIIEDYAGHKGEGLVVWVDGDNDDLHDLLFGVGGVRAVHTNIHDRSYIVWLDPRYDIGEVTSLIMQELKAHVLGLHSKWKQTSDMVVKSVEISSIATRALGLMSMLFGGKLIRGEELTDTEEELMSTLRAANRAILDVKNRTDTKE